MEKFFEALDKAAWFLQRYKAIHGKGVDYDTRRGSASSGEAPGSGAPANQAAEPQPERPARLEDLCQPPSPHRTRIPIPHTGIVLEITGEAAGQVSTGLDRRVPARELEQREWGHP